MAAHRRKPQNAPRVVSSVGMPLPVDRKARQAARILGISKNALMVAATEEKSDAVIAHAQQEKARLAAAS